MIIQRAIQKVRLGRWAWLQAIDKKFTAIENRVGFPAKKRYQCIIGGHTQGTLIVERQWDSFAAWEAAEEEIRKIPEYRALAAEVMEVIESQQIEAYVLLP